MSSFQITITPSKRAAGRFISKVRRSIQKALAEEHQKSGLTQSAMARAIGVHRSVINRELVGRKDITLGRIGELAWALGRVPIFDLVESSAQAGMMPIKTVTVDISQAPSADADPTFIQNMLEEIKKQAGAQTPVAA